MINTGTSRLSAATAHPRPPIRRTARANRPRVRVTPLRNTLVRCTNNRAREGGRAGPGNFRTRFSRAASGDFSPRNYVGSVLQPRNPHVHQQQQSTTIETQPTTARFKWRREQSGKDRVSQESHDLVPFNQTPLFVLALSERFRG